MPRQKSDFSDYRQQLLKEFESRKSKRPKYTLRAFARDLRISPATLVTLFNGKSHLRVTTAIKIAGRLNWPEEQTASMITEIGQIQAGRSRKGLAHPCESIGMEKAFYPLADWKVMAVGHLARLPECNSDPKWIADRLNIPVSDAEESIRILSEHGYARVVDGKLRLIKPVGPFRITSSSEPVIRYQQALLKKASESIETAPKGAYANLFRMLPIRKEDLPQFESLIWSFYLKLEKKTDGRTPDRLYCLGVQLFPLSD